jgi:hypothetical protein
MAATQDAPAKDTAQQTVLTLRTLDAPIGEQLGLPGWLIVGGLYRGRLEQDSALGFVPGASDTYYLQRFRLDLTIRPTSWLRFKAEMQDAHNWLYGSRALPANSANPLDLREAYAVIGNEGSKGLSLKIGRQEIALGGKRLVTAGDWSNAARTFDAVRATYLLPAAGLSLDVLAGSVILNDPNRFDRHLAGERLYGAYTKFGKLVPGMSIEPYYLLRTQLHVKGERAGTGNSTLSTGGLRVTGTLPGRIDYNADVARQWGIYASDRVAALAGTYTLGWRVTRADWKPRISVEFNHASGDGAAKDGRRQTFDSLYAGHNYYGLADQVGWRNLRNARVGFDCFVTRKLQLRVDFNEDYLATVQDGLYNTGGTLKVLNRNAASRHIGSEPDLLAIYQLTRNTSVQAGYSHLFAGEFLKQSTKGGGYSSPFVMWTKTF